MKTFQTIIPAFGFIAAARAWGSDWNNTYVTTTVTTDIYTTYCPYATTFPYGGQTYTATASEYITITDCPCTYVTSHPGKPTSYPHTYVYPTSPATWLPPVYVTSTETVATYTTYCPVPTTVVQGSSTYTVTEATTLTITDCPCTAVVTKPDTAVEYTTKTFETLTTYCPVPTTITYHSQTYPVTTPGYVTIPIVSVSPLPPSTVAEATSGGTVVPVGPTASASGPVQVTNAATKNAAGLGALAAAGLAMLF